MIKVERFILKPRIQLFFGRTVTKELVFDEWTENKEVHQTLKNLKLITVVTKEYKNDILNTKEYTKLVQELKEGQIIIWTEEMGYVIPEYSMTTVEDAIEELEPLIEFSNRGDVNNESERNEREGIQVN